MIFKGSKSEIPEGSMVKIHEWTPYRHSTMIDYLGVRVQVLKSELEGVEPQLLPIQLSPEVQKWLLATQQTLQVKLPTLGDPSRLTDTFWVSADGGAPDP